MRHRICLGLTGCFNEGNGGRYRKHGNSLLHQRCVGCESDPAKP